MDRETNEESVFIETTIHEAVEKVWEAWTEPDIIMKWFGSDPNGEVLSAKLDVRPRRTFAKHLKIPTKPGILVVAFIMR